MRKTFCDVCNGEMTGTSQVVSRIHKGMTTYLFITRPDGDLKIDVCQGCVIDSVAAADDRPKPAMPAPLDSRRLHEIIDASEKAGDLGDILRQTLRNEFP